MKDVIAPNIRGLVRRAWSEGQAIDLHGIGYGRIHWGNERDIHAEPFPYYHFLAGLVSAMGVRTVLEIGTHWGGSALAMQRGMNGREGASIVTVDISAESDAQLDGVAGITKIQGDANSEGVFNAVTERLESVDLLFVDSTHDFWPTYMSYSLYDTRYEPGLLVFDDITLNRDMHRFWKLLTARFPAKNCINVSDIVPQVRPTDDGPGFGLIARDSVFF